MHTTIEVGKVEGRRAFVEIEIEDRGKGARLSISGNVHGGGGGQNINEIARVSEFAPGWSDEKFARLIEVWRTWHLNDTRAGCSHQRAGWDLDKKIEIKTYSIDWDVRRGIERQADRDLAAICPTEPHADGKQHPHYGAHAMNTPTQRRQFERFSTGYGLLALLDRAGIKPFSWTAIKDGKTLATLAHGFDFITEREKPAHDKKARDWDNSDRMIKGPRPNPPILVRTESKGAGWVNPKEHPDGLLMKPCEVCGYKYGSAWLYEPIPADVIAFIEEIASATPDAGSPYDAQAADFLARFGLSLTIARGNGKCPPWELADCKKGKHAHGHHYRITVRPTGASPARDECARLAFDFWGSQFDASKQTDPSAYSVLTCLGSDIGTSDDPDEIAQEFGEMKPSQAIRIAEWGIKLRAFFTEDEQSALGEIR